MITERQIDGIIQKIVKNYKPKKVILFGSYAYGKPTTDSDLDLLIIKETNLPRFKRGREINRLFNPYPFAMDILVYTPGEIKKRMGNKSSFLHEAITKGRVLYG